MASGVSVIAALPGCDYRRLMRMILSLCVLALIPGCAVLDRLAPKRADTSVAGAATNPVPDEAPPTALAPMVPAGAATASALDKTTSAERKEALAVAPVSGETQLGRVAVALGNPAEQGFWLRSALVKVAGKGRVQTASGQSVAVDLLPGETGAQLSLAAFRALGLALTDLPEVTVYAN